DVLMLIVECLDRRGGVVGDETCTGGAGSGGCWSNGRLQQQRRVGVQRDLVTDMIGIAGEGIGDRGGVVEDAGVENAVAHAVVGYGGKLRRGAVQGVTGLGVEEEEALVVPVIDVWDIDRAADVAAKLIA